MKYNQTYLAENEIITILLKFKTLDYIQFIVLEVYLINRLPKVTFTLNNVL